MAKKNNNEIFESSSSTDFKVVKLKHTWVINNFSLSCEETGQFLLSPTFSAGTNNEKSEWYLKLHPKGENDKSNKYVSLFLLLDKCNGKGLYATYNFSIMNAKNTSNVVRIWNGSNRFMVSGNGWGCANFVEQTFLYNKINECLLEDKLTIVCEITARIGGSENIFQATK